MTQDEKRFYDIKKALLHSISEAEKRRERRDSAQLEASLSRGAKEVANYQLEREKEKITSLKLNNEKIRLSNRRLQQENKWAERENNDRKWYGKIIINFVLFYVITITLFSIFYILKLSPKDPDMVVITLLGTTTVSIIGIGFIVIKYLFPERRR